MLFYITFITFGLRLKFKLLSSKMQCNPCSFKAHMMELIDLDNRGREKKTSSLERNVKSN